MNLIPRRRFLGIRIFNQITSASSGPLLSSSSFTAKYSIMANAEADRKRAMIAIQGVFDKYHLITHNEKVPYFDYKVMRDAKLIDGSMSGRASFTLLISPDYGNINGVMHGGAAGVIFDMCTTVALAPLSKPGYWDFLGGVTRSLNISYLRAIPLGTTVRINSRVVQVGRTMALIQGEMVTVDGKTTFATVEHHKVCVPTPKHHLKPEFNVEWDRIMREEANWKGEKAKI